jgi:hypothetical protein
MMPLLRAAAADRAGTCDPTSNTANSTGTPLRTSTARRSPLASGFVWQRAGPPGHVNAPPPPSQATRVVRIAGRQITPLAKVDSNRSGGALCSQRQPAKAAAAPAPTVPQNTHASAAVAGGFTAPSIANLAGATSGAPSSPRHFAMAHLRNTAVMASGCGSGRGLPSDTQLDAWRLALCLPGNKAAYLGCSELSLPPQQEAAVRAAGITSPRLERHLRHVMAAVLQWCPDLCHVEHIAETCFPFVKLWGVDGVSAAETAMVFWGSWGRRWIEALPLPPLQQTNVLDDRRARRDRLWA